MAGRGRSRGGIGIGSRPGTARRRTRLGLAMLLAGGAVVAVATVLTARHPAPDRAAGPPLPPPIDPEPHGRCVELVADTGAAPCPYQPAAVPAGGIDRAAPFTRGGRCVDAGLLTIDSGRVTATDPLVFLDLPPFSQEVPRGRARVWLAVSGTQIGFALLAFGDQRPVRWSPARDAGGGEAYPVDTGVGCFADAATAAALIARHAQLRDRAAAIATAAVSPSRAERWREIYDREMKRAPDLLELLDRAGLERGWANLCVDPATGANLIVFSSGLGDGSYRSWFGFDAADHVVALVTDFRVEDLGAGRHPYLEGVDPR